MRKVELFDAVGLALALTLSNFIWQVFQSDPSWSVAIERSFFQAAAVLLAWNMWREREPKPQRRGQGPGWCD